MRILSVAIVLSVALWHFLISPAPAVSAMPVAVSTADNGQPMNLGALARRPTTDEQHTAQPQTKELRFSAAVKIDNTVERVLHFLAKRLGETDVKLPPKPKHPPKCGFYTRGCPPKVEDTKAEKALGIDEGEANVERGFGGDLAHQGRNEAQVVRETAGYVSSAARSGDDSDEEAETKRANEHGNEAEQYHAARASFKRGQGTSELETKDESWGKHELRALDVNTQEGKGDVSAGFVKGADA